MKTSLILPAALLALSVAAVPSRADEAAAAPDSVPAANLAEAPVPDHIVYLARLPAPADLTRAAEARGTTINRIDQTGDRITVVYQYSGGRSKTIAYALLSSAQDASAPVTTAASAPPPVTVVAARPAPQVVYTQPAQVVYTEPPVVYYPRYVREYDPVWDFWAPLSVGVGLAWVGGHNGWWGHGWHGGYHGHGHGWRH